MDMNDPWTVGLALSTLGSQDMSSAQKAALFKQIVEAGFSQTGGASALDVGSTIDPAAPMIPSQQAVAPTAAQQSAVTPQQLMQLASMGGVKAPAPIQPLMHGGVTGGVPPPQAKMGVNAQAPAIQALLAAMLGHAGPPPIGALNPGMLRR